MKNRTGSNDKYSRPLNRKDKLSFDEAIEQDRKAPHNKNNCKKSGK